MPGTIVVVDDDRDFLEMEKSILSSDGWVVVPFSDPRAALAALRDPVRIPSPSLLITDLMMNQLDAGFSLARAVKAEPRLAGLRVIIVTAVAGQRGFDFRPRGADDLAAMGADAFLDKPVAPATLLAKVRELAR
jgi:CheY-like chemotaxis protein